ncbi:MAG: metal-dependent hydrolase [bacterium]
MMPTPIGHSLAGLLLSKTKIFVPSRSTYKSIAVAMILANLADADFVPGLLSGNPNEFHHGVTHSVGASFFVGFLFAGYFFYRQRRFLAPFIFATVGYSSHIVFDFFAVDTSMPRGIPALWPFSPEYFISPIAVFSDVRRSAASGTFFQSLFIAHNGWTVCREMLVLAPMLLIVQIRRYLKGRIVQLND